MRKKPLPVPAKATKKSSLLCVGHVTLDTFMTVLDAEVHCDINHRDCKVCFDFGSKLPVESVCYGIGGGAGNVSVGTTNLGINTSIYTIIGNDPKGKDIKESLKKHRVGVKHVKEDLNPTDQASVISYKHDRTIFTYSFPREYQVHKYWDEYDNIFISSVGDNVSKLYSQAILYKKKNPKTTIFYNPGSRELKNSRDDVLRMIEHVDYLIANLEEGCTILNSSLKVNDIEINDLLNLLVEKGIKNVVLTAGLKGVYATNKDYEFHVPAKKVRMVEKTGAGDAFASAFIASTIYKNEMETSLKWGVINASGVITKIGAQEGLLTKTQIEKGL